MAVGAEARQTLSSALLEVSRAVGSTLGPNGSPFGFDKLGQDMRPVVSFTKDGLTVLKALGFDDPAKEAVLNYCKQAAASSVLASGDGTTSTIVLANAICQSILNSGDTVNQLLARKIEHAATVAADQIAKEAMTGQELLQKVALTSTNGDKELTDVVLEAIQYSGAFGTFYAEKDPASKTRYAIERQAGYSNCHGYNYNQYFAISADQPAASASRPIVWERPNIALFNGHLLQLSQLQPILNAWNEKLKSEGASKLVIVTYETGDEATNHLMVLNRQLAASGASVFIVKIRLTAEINSGMQILFDLAASCGVSDKKIIDGGNLKIMDGSYFGTCPQVQIRPNTTMFLGRATNHWVEDRVKQNQAIIDEARSPFDKEITGLRNAELAEGLVKVKVGGGLVSELQERTDRLDDAIKAAQACLRSGALPGCGVSYIRAANLAEQAGAGSLILSRAMRSIHDQIIENLTGSTEQAIQNPGRGMTIAAVQRSGELELSQGFAFDLGVMDATETVAAVIKNGVQLGISIALLGGYSYRDATKSTEEFE
jgi:chaperonin GroEL